MPDEIQRLTEVIADCDRAIATFLRLLPEAEYDGILAELRVRRTAAANQLAEIEAASAVRDSQVRTPVS